MDTKLETARAPRTATERRRIAIVGTGISGLIVAYRLAAQHDVHLYEAADYVGGHTNTVRVEASDGVHYVDTGFIVHNTLNYPNLVRVFRELDVPVRDTTMSFSVRCDRSGVEYASRGFDGLFAQRRNLVNPTHLGMLREVLRWNRTAEQVTRDLPESVTLGDLMAREGYSQVFVDRFIVPMGAAIWSTEASRMMRFPAAYFVQFLANHRMLTPLDQPTWRTVVGGSHEYVKRMTVGFADRIRLSTPVIGIRREHDGVVVRDARGGTERFDDVVLATHSDQSLRLLEDPTPNEREILGAIEFQPNDAVLHTDTSVLPRERRAWTSWNYRIPRDPQAGVAVSYSMNILQGLTSRDHYVVSLNETGIDPSKIVKKIVYHHPLYTPAGVAAQKRRAEICGVNRTHYAGAYWGFGFHEDGARSGLEVAARFASARDATATIRAEAAE